MRYSLLIVFIFISTFSRTQPVLQEGIWRGELKLNDTTFLPFNFEVFRNYLEIINGDERILVDELTYADDSVFIQMPVYETELRCLLKGNILEGHFINHTRIMNGILDFRAVQGISWRFTDRSEKPSYNITGRWHVSWDNEEGENKMSIGVFEQEGGRVTGTFLTPTGDYRFLEGEMSGSHLSLSAFDASHAYLFDAVIQQDSSLRGNYYSGSHWHDTWKAWRSEDAALVDPESMTYLKPGYKGMSFSFPDENENLISLSDAKYSNKVVIIQLMGTWCSNCLDESIYLVELSEFFSPEKFQVIALDFEKTSDSLRVFNNIRRIKERLGIKYPVLYAGSANKQEAAKQLPMLNRIAAFPTTLVLDKKGAVRKIYTGFNGPATGQEYIKYKTTFLAFIQMLLEE